MSIKEKKYTLHEILNVALRGNVKNKFITEQS